MTTVTTTRFQANDTRIHIQFIMGNQDRFRCDIVEFGERNNTFTGKIHKGCWEKETDVLTFDIATTAKSIEFRVFFEGNAILICKAFYEPEACIMAGLGILRTWVTQTYNQ